MTTVAEAKFQLSQKQNAYRQIFTGSNAELVLEDLAQKFNGTTLKKVNGVIDANSSIAAAGCREVLLYIEQMMRVKDAVD